METEIVNALDDIKDILPLAIDKILKSKDIFLFEEGCEETLDRMNDNYIDLTVTSPPYNVNLGDNKHNKDQSYDSYNDNMTHNEYMEWIRKVFTKIYTKTVSGGRCIINIGDGKNGKVPTHSDYINVMREIGWLTMSIIVWDKKNVSARTAWGSFASPSSPSMPTPFEYILVFAKDRYKLSSHSESVSDITNEEFVDWSLAMWTFAGEKRSRIGHPAPFPVELPLRCVKFFSWRDAIVYDPFAGSGTTALACLETGRKFIGSEISSNYVDIALDRIGVAIND